MTESAKPTLIFYGNCQAGALASILGADATIKSQFEIHYLASFNDRVPGTSEIQPSAVAAAAVLFEQNDPAAFPHRSLLHARCVTIRFPSLDFNLLWPLNCKNAFNDPPTPAHLWGHFPYGDRVIVEGVQRGDTADDILRSYEATSGERLANLDRLAELEWRRLADRDAKCDVTMADHIQAAFRFVNLFWCVNHPTLEALQELAFRLIGAVNDRGLPLPATSLAQTLALLPPQGPLGFLRVPIHPDVARHFGLRWVPGAAEKQYGLREDFLTYEGYFRQMVERSIGVRDARESTVAP